MKILPLLALAAVLLPALPARGQAAPPAACPALLQHTFPRLQDEKPQSLCQYAGQVLLVVNTASFCGFTQERGSNREIAEFCANTFGVRFPMFAKSSVRGAGANPLFRQLAAGNGQAPRWNFHKYLIGRDGRLVAHWGSTTRPDDPALVRTLEQALARR